MRDFEISMEIGKYHRRYKGSFAPSGAGISAAAGAIRGVGFTPSHSGTTGIYRVTLEDPFVRLISLNLTFQSENAFTSAVLLQAGAENTAAGTIDIISWVESAGTFAKANITASGVLRRIHFEAIVAAEDLPRAGASA